MDTHTFKDGPISEFIGNSSERSVHAWIEAKKKIVEAVDQEFEAFMAEHGRTPDSAEDIHPALINALACSFLLYVAQCASDPAQFHAIVNMSMNLSFKTQEDVIMRRVYDNHAKMMEAYAEAAGSTKN